MKERTKTNDDNGRERIPDQPGSDNSDKFHRPFRRMTIDVLSMLIYKLRYNTVKRVLQCKVLVASRRHFSFSNRNKVRSVQEVEKFTIKEVGGTISRIALVSTENFDFTPVLRRTWLRLITTSSFGDIASHFYKTKKEDGTRPFPVLESSKPNHVSSEKIFSKEKTFHVSYGYRKIEFS